jgi:uncharacterized protein (UPF0261 family)
MVNFWAPDTIPQEFKDRRFHEHNPTVTLMRTTADENAKVGAEIGRKVAATTGPAAIMLPLQGVSAIDRAGESFDDPQAREALFAAVRENHGNVELIECDHHINDDAFAEAAANKLIDIM